MAEVLLYGEIYSWTAREFIRDVERANGDLTARINSNGGEVEYGWGMVAKFSEYKGKKLVKIDGAAHSMAAYFAVYADDVEALDVSTMIFHRAAWPEWIENNPVNFTEEMRSRAENINTHLRAAMESKIGAEKWLSVTGTTLDDLFDMSQRIDVEVTAEQAKELGIVSKINSITPTKKAEIESRMVAVAEKFTGIKLAAKAETPKANQNPIKMTIDKLKAEHPDVYAAAVKAGVNQERDRVGAWVTFADVDVKAVTEGIKSGDAISATVTAELSRKAFSAQAVTALENGSPKPLATTEPETTTEDSSPVNPELAALEAQVNKFLNIK
jgi:ATP-dependent protease ClpP protease subunit